MAITTTGGNGSIMMVGITMVMMVAAMVMTGMPCGGPFGLDREGLKR